MVIIHNLRNLGPPPPTVHVHLCAHLERHEYPVDAGREEAVALERPEAEPVEVLAQERERLDLPVDEVGGGEVEVEGGVLLHEALEVGRREVIPEEHLLVRRYVLALGTPRNHMPFKVVAVLPHYKPSFKLFVYRSVLVSVRKIVIFEMSIS